MTERKYINIYDVKDDYLVVDLLDESHVAIDTVAISKESYLNMKPEEQSRNYILTSESTLELAAQVAKENHIKKY